MSLHLLTGYYLFFTDLPLLDCLPHLGVAIVGSCIWVLVNNVRKGIASGVLVDQGREEDIERFQEVAL